VPLVGFSQFEFFTKCWGKEIEVKGVGIVVVVSMRI
jgi:hypothetical protein